MSPSNDWFMRQSQPPPEVSLTSTTEPQRPTEQRVTTVGKGQAAPVLLSSVTEGMLTALEGGSVTLAAACGVLAVIVFSGIVWLGRRSPVSGIAEVFLLVLVLLAAGHYFLWTAVGRAIPCRRKSPLVVGGALVLSTGAALAGALVLFLRGLTAESYREWWGMLVVLILVTLTAVYIRNIFNPARNARSLIANMSRTWAAFCQPRPIFSPRTLWRQQSVSCWRPVDGDIAVVAAVIGGTPFSLLRRDSKRRQASNLPGGRWPKGGIRARAKVGILFKAWRAIVRDEERWVSDHFVGLENGERVRVVHCEFSPPFEHLPQVIARVVRPDGLRARVLRSYPYGARIELRRSVPGPALTVHLRVRASAQRRIWQKV